MLSGGAAETEDSSEREKGQSPLYQPSGTELSLNQPSGTELSLNHPPGTELSPIQPSGSEPSIVQPSGSEPSIVQPQVATGSVKAPAPMPYFTGRLPGTVRLLPPRKNKVTSVVTMSSNGESTIKTPTITTQVEEITCPIRDARLKEIVERQRNGTWDGIPRCVERLKRIPKDEGADKSKDIPKSEEVTALLDLGGTNAAANKPGSDDDGLGQDLHDILNGMDVSPNGKGNVTPPLIVG
jgi:hypothetical protein